MRSTSNNEFFRAIGVSTVLCWITCVAVAMTLYLVFFYAPTEKTMGVVQRIFYVHISSAWIAFLAFFIVMVASIVYLIMDRRKWDNIAHASAELGTLFCTLVLITGPLWSKPGWNVWWTWDLRLTAILVLWLMYVAYLILRKYAQGERGARGAAVLGIIAFFDVPVVYFSIRWGKTQQPAPVIIGGSDIGLEPEMKVTLFVSLITFTLLFFYLFQHRVAIERMEDELEQIRRTIVEREQNARDFLIENEDFVIEDYIFKEYKKDE